MDSGSQPCSTAASASIRSRASQPDVNQSATSTPIAVRMHRTPTSASACLHHICRNNLLIHCSSISTIEHRATRRQQTTKPHHARARTSASTYAAVSPPSPPPARSTDSSAAPCPCSAARRWRLRPRAAPMIVASRHALWLPAEWRMSRISCCADSLSPPMLSTANGRCTARIASATNLYLSPFTEQRSVWCDVAVVDTLQYLAIAASAPAKLAEEAARKKVNKYELVAGTKRAVHCPSLSRRWAGEASRRSAARAWRCRRVWRGSGSWRWELVLRE